MASSKAAPEMDDLPTFLMKVIQRVPGLHAAVISDREGVAVVKASSGPEREEDLALSTAFATATEYASKLKLGRNRTITSFHKDRIVVQVNYAPMLLTFVGDTECNVGVLQTLLPDIKTALDPLLTFIRDEEMTMSM